MSYPFSSFPAAFLQVDASEADQVDRYLKRANKDTKYKQTVVELSGGIDLAVKQNNTIDMYEEYFSDYTLGELYIHIKMHCCSL